MKWHHLIQLSAKDWVVVFSSGILSLALLQTHAVFLSGRLTDELSLVWVIMAPLVSEVLKKKKKKKKKTLFPQSYSPSPPTQVSSGSRWVIGKSNWRSRQSRVCGGRKCKRRIICRASWSNTARRGTRSLFERDAWTTTRRITSRRLVPRVRPV